MMNLNDHPINEIICLTPGDTGLTTFVSIGEIDGDGPYVKVKNNPGPLYENDSDCFVLNVKDGSRCVNLEMIKLSEQEYMNTVKWCSQNDHTILELYNNLVNGGAMLPLYRKLKVLNEIQ